MSRALFEDAGLEKTEVERAGLRLDGTRATALHFQK
jgi:hypothetical protein